MIHFGCQSESGGDKGTRGCALEIDSKGASIVSTGGTRGFPCGRAGYIMSFGGHDSAANESVDMPLFGACRVGGLDELQDSGFCYLSLVRDEHVDEVRRVVGPWPTVREIVEIPREMVDPNSLDVVRATRVGAGWHFSQVGHANVGRLLQLEALGCRQLLDGESLGCALLDLWFGDEVYSVDGVAGGTFPDCVDLRELYGKDFSVCRCKVHEPPVTKNLPGVTVGCAQKPAGKAGVIDSAFHGRSRMCHADERTRAQDKKMLEILLQNGDPGLLDGGVRPPELDALCTSSEHADMAAFGNGYCYLALLHHDTWWRAARLLGPNPLLSSLHRVLLWLGKPASKRHKIVQVSDGYYHVVVDKASKGVVNSAGRDVCVQVEGVLRAQPRARVGGWFSGSQSVASELKLEECVDIRAFVEHGDVSMVKLREWVDSESTVYLSFPAVDGSVKVGFPLELEESVGCWYLDSSYKKVVRSVTIEGVKHEFPDFGGVRVWFTQRFSADVELDGLSSLVCKVKYCGTSGHSEALV